MSYQKYLKPKNILTYSSINYLQALISFGVSFFLARELGKTQFGYYAHGLVFANTLFTLIQFGQEKTLVRDLIQLNNPSATFWAATLIKLTLGFLFIIMLLIWLLGVSDLNEFRIKIILLCGGSGMIRAWSPKAYFDYNGKINRQALYVLIDRIVYLLGSISLIYWFHSQRIVLFIAVCLLLSRLIAAILEWIYIYRNVPFHWDSTIAEVKTLLSSSVYVWIAAIGNLLMTQVNQLVLEGKMGAAELGLYGFALQLIMLVRLLQTQITRLVTPSIANIVSESSKKEILKKWGRYSLLSMCATLFLVIPLYVFSGFIIRKLTGNEFVSSVPIFNVLLVWVTIFGVALINNQFLLSFRLQKQYMLVTLFFGIVSLYLSHYFINKYAGIGAALALLIAHFGSIITQFILVYRKVNKM